MRSLYSNFARMFDLNALSHTSQNIVNSLWTLSNIQLVQLLQLNNHNHFKYNEISQAIQFVSISGNIDILENEWIIYLVFIFNFVLLILMTYCTVKGRIGKMKHIQISILIYCSILEYPIISIMIQFILNYENFRENLIIYIAASNLFFYFCIQILQQIFGKSFCLEINDCYTPLLQLGLNSLIRLFKSFITSIAYISDDKFTCFILLTIYQFLQFYQQFKFVKATSFKMVCIFCQQIICVIIYLNISIVWSLILIMLTYGVATQYHQYLYHNLISNQCKSDLNIAYVCTELSKQNCNFIEQYFILQHHLCLKCKNIIDMQVCILKKLKFNKQQDKRINLLYSNKISNQYPIKALISLIKSQQGLRIDYQIQYTRQIIDLKNQINKIQLFVELKDETNTLTCCIINESIKLYEAIMTQFLEIINGQISFWKKAQQGFQSNYQCLVQIKNVSKRMIENKRYLVKFTQKHNLNIIELKILQIHYAVVYLDPRKIYSYQKQIDDKLLQDRYKLDKNVNNKVLYEGRYLLVQTSLVFNKGQLINFKQQNYNQFYNLPYDQPNQIERIEDLMPSFKRSTHNKFLDNYIRKGYSSFDKSGLDIFICTPEDYIIMANLQVNYDSSIMNDVVLTGLIAKEQNINKAILISLDGQILGMDKGTFEIIKNNAQIKMDISTLVMKGYFIQSFIKNIQKSIDLLNENFKLINQCQLLNLNDQWVVEQHNNQYIQINNQIIDQKENINNQIYSENNIGNNIVYNLFYVNHYQKGGELCYFKIIIIEQDANCYNKILSHQSQSLNSKKSQSISNQTSDQGKKENRVSIQISQLNQNYKFFTDLLSQNQQHDIIQEDIYKKEEIDIMTPRQDENQLIQQVQDQNTFKKPKVIKQRNVEQSMTSKRSSEDSQYFTIINNLYDQQKMFRPLVNISFILSLAIFYTLIIIFVNQAQIQNSVNNKLAQITILRKPQNITYIYTSLSFQLLFKYANQKEFVEMSPFMIYWNQVQQNYMYKYIESLIVPLNIEVPIIANSFNKNTIVEHIFINDEQYEIEVQLDQFYNQIVQYFCLLRVDDQFDSNIKTLMNEGFLKENLVKLFQLNDELLKQINIIVTNLQLTEISVFLLTMLIELLILMVFYSIQFAWWKNIDKIITELILIVHRTKVSQIEQQVENLQMIKDILLLDNSSWIQSPIQNYILDSQEVERNQRKQQLITIMPQDYYINKKNLLICIAILIINLLFNVTGYLIYSEQNVKFQISLSSMSNYVQFLHDTDCSFLFAGFIKLDGPLNGDKTYLLDQEEIIKALNKTSNQLLPQLENLQHMIYGSSLQDNQMFYQLLFQNLCETSSQQLVMCDSSTIEQEYWEKDNYNYLISNGIIGFTNQFMKFVTENYQYEFQNLQYTSIEQSKQIIDQPIFQNLFLQYFLDLQETLRIFLKTFQKQNTKMGQDIVSLLQGYYIGFGMFFVLMSGIAYYYWVQHNQYQIYLALQIIGIIPNSHVISQNFKPQVLKLYKSIY